jgi:hypothetical protein
MYCEVHELVGGFRCFIFVVLGIKPEALHARQELYHLSHIPSPFWFVCLFICFEIGSP